MTMNNKKFIVTALASASILYCFGFFYQGLLKNEEYVFNLEKIIPWKESKLTELVDPNQFVKIKPYLCRQSKEFDGGVSAQICIKPIKTDIHVSGGIERDGAWEFGIVNNVVKGLRQFPDATFLDIGCNIGMYTVVVAAMGRQVVAVDADPRNLAYVRTSLELSNNTGNVRIFHNAVSDEYTEYYPVNPDPTNEGDTRMETKDGIVTGNMKKSGPLLSSVKTIDIFEAITSETIIIKIDVQGFECKALPSDILLGKVGKYVPMIFIEWGWLPTYTTIHCPDYKSWLEHFYNGGYIPHEPWNMKEVTREEVEKQFDLVWIKKTKDFE